MKAFAKILLNNIYSLGNLNLNWSQLNQDSLESILQEDLKRELAGPLVEAVSKGNKRARTNKAQIYKEMGSKISMYIIHARMRMPFKWIPSCSGFKIVIGPWDWIMQLFGREVRSRSNEMLFRNWRNGRPNKNLFHIFLTLGKYRDAGDMENYWKLGWRLMRNHSYQVSAFNYVFHNWSRGILSNGKEMSLPEVITILEKVKVLCASKSTEIKFKRVYIPKNEDLPMEGKNVRPLGVPAAEWRVYLHMLNNLIVWSRTGQEGSQHAYFPRRGVATAWREIMNNLPRWDYIYEIDLTGFFDNVTHQGLNDYMKKLGYPQEEIKRLINMCKSIVKLTQADLIEEPDRDKPLLPSGNLSVNWKDKSLITELDHGDGGDKGLQVVFNNKMIKLLETKPSTIKMEDFLQKINEEFRIRQRSIKLPFEGDLKMKGVPQGAATSCSLATMANQELAGIRVIQQPMGPPIIILGVFYADDALIFSNSKDCKHYIDDERTGIAVNESKSRWIKQEGKWVVDSFKFLGLRYNVPKFMRPESIEANTRKGATLKITQRDLFQNWLLIGRDRLIKAALFRERMHAFDWFKSSKQNKTKITREQISQILTPEEVIKYGGSALSLNDNYPESLRTWIWQEYFTFLIYPRKLQLLFSSRWTGYYLSRMYLNSWEWVGKQDFSLKAHPLSWCSLRWARYANINRKDLFWGVSENPMTNATKLHPGHGLDLDKLMELGDGIKNIGRELKELVNEVEIIMTANNKTNKASKAADRIITIGHLMVKPIEIKLNIWNASSFACHDLLTNYPLENPSFQISGLMKKDLKKGVIKKSTRNKILSLLAKWDMELKPNIRWYFKTPKMNKNKSKRPNKSPLISKLETLKIGVTTVKDVVGSLKPLEMSIINLQMIKTIGGWSIVSLALCQLVIITMLNWMGSYCNKIIIIVKIRKTISSLMTYIGQLNENNNNIWGCVCYYLKIINIESSIIKIKILRLQEFIKWLRTLTNKIK